MDISVTFPFYCEWTFFWNVHRSQRIIQWSDRDKMEEHKIILTNIGGGVMGNTQNKMEHSIILTEADEKAFLKQLKQGIYKELYRRECLTSEQLKQLQNIA